MRSLLASAAAVWRRAYAAPPSRGARGLARFAIFGAVIMLSGCGLGRGLDSDELRQLELDWELYQVGDPSWPSVRDRWYARDGEARELLVDLLIRDLLVHSMSREWTRPQRELLSVGSDPTVRRLIETMRGLREPAALEAVSATLSGFGAVDEVLTALESPAVGDSPAFPLFALRTLVSAGGERSIDYVGRQITGSGDWERRAAAADALAKARISDQPRAAQALLPGLNDADPFVIQRVLSSLSELNQPAAAPAVAELLGRTSNPAVGQAAVATLRRLTGVSVPGNDPAGWSVAAMRAAAR